MLRRFIFIALVVLAAFVAYWPAMNGGFVWDDSSWTSQLAPLMADWTGLLRMWTSSTAMQQYYPLMGTTFWVDHQLWGDWTLPYHVENLLLHLASAFLFWQLLKRLGVSGAWLSALVLVFHPTMVESVAWITERKNVLCLTLLLTAMLYYGRFTGYWRNEAELRRPRDWVVAFAFFTAALLAKVTAYVMPPGLLLLCWWKRGRIRWREDVMPTLPFFTTAGALGLLVTWLEKHHVGAEGMEFQMSLVDRCLIAGRVPWAYLGKLVWPAGLCPVDRSWTNDPTHWALWLGVAATLVIVPLLWFARARVGRGPLVAALLFLGALVPVSGFLNVYGMLFAFTADRWLYVPSLSIFALAGAGGVRLAHHCKARWLPSVVALVMVPIFGGLSWQHTHAYVGMEEFWATVLKGNPKCWVGWHQTGLYHQNQGQLDEAIECYQKALALRPHYPEAHLNLGTSMLRKGDLAGAISEFKQALEIAPQLPAANFNLGNCLRAQGLVEAAMKCYRKELERSPDLTDASNNLACLYLQQGMAVEAQPLLEQAVKSSPQRADIFGNLGFCFSIQGQTTEAIRCYEQALKQDANLSAALNNLAWLLATHHDSIHRDGHRAIELAERLSNLPSSRDQPGPQRTLAAANAEAGKFEEAVRFANTAMRLASGLSHHDLANQIERELQCYQRQEPLRQ